MEQILSELKSTRYSHKTMVDEDAGMYHLDCSGLACYVLKHVAPKALAAVPKDGRPRARAKDFYEAFSSAPINESGNGWQRIVRLLDAEPGDVIAWRKDPLPPKGNTGHVVIVMGKPVADGKNTVRVRICDSSKSRHAQDTRAKGDTGIGVGVMWFRVDDNGAPIAVHWSRPKRKPVPYPIAIGRALSVTFESPDKP